VDAMCYPPVPGPSFVSAGSPHPITGVAATLTLGHELAGRVVAVGDRVDVSAWECAPPPAGLEKEILGSLSHVMDEDFVVTLDLLAWGALRYQPLVTLVRLEHSVGRGIKALADRLDRYLKIVVSHDRV